MSDDILDTSNFVSGDVADIDAAKNAVIDNMNASAEAEAAAQEQTEAGNGEEGEGQETQEEEQRAKPKKTFQERMDEVTRARREAEREAAHWRKIAEARAAEVPQTEQDNAPNPEDFEYGDTDPRYLMALVKHETQKGIDEARRSMAEENERQAQARVWEAAQEAARAEFDDFDTVITAKDEAGAIAWDCSPIMAQTIKSIPDGAKLAYQLAVDPAESKRIAALPEPLQLIEAGRLMARFETAKSAPAKQTKTATDAPRPPETQARGAGGKFTVAADTEDFAAFEANIAANW